MTVLVQAIQELEAKRAEIDHAIQVLHAQLNGASAGGSTPRQRLAAPAARHPGGKGGVRGTRKLEQRRAAAQMWRNGIPAAEIAKKVGVNPATIYNWKKQDGWPEQPER